MGRIKQGNGYRIPTTVQQRNLDGTYTLVTPTTIVGTLQFPDQTTAPFTPTLDGVGLYHSDLSPATLTELGHYQWQVQTSGPGASTQIGVIDVSAGLAPTHVDFFDAKARLNVSSLADAEIQDMIDSAISEQEQRVGPVAPRIASKIVTPSSGVLLLPPPVISITSITPAGGSPLSLVGLDLSGLSAGIVRPGSSAYWWSATAYTVVFVAGRNPVPQDLVEAALLRVQASYETQRGPTTLPLSDGGDFAPSTSYPLILRAQDKERPYVLPAVA